MKHMVKAILFVSVFLRTDGLDAQSDFLSVIRLTHWAPGTLVLKDGHTVAGEINYDYATNFVQVRQGDSISLYNDRIIASLEFDWFDGPEKATFRNLRIDGPERMYRVLFENQHLAFLSYYDVEMESFGPINSSRKPVGFFVTQPLEFTPKPENKTLYVSSWKEQFVLVSASGDFKELGSIFIVPVEETGELGLSTLMTRKGLSKKLKAYTPAVKGYMEEKNINLNKRNHIIDVFRYVFASVRD